ncbi:MAG: hypothetical protein ABIB61_04485 [Candidatus Shapirobacteria bacterium]
MRKLWVLVFIVASFLPLAFPSLALADSVNDFGYNIVNNFYSPNGTFNTAAFERLQNGSATVRLVSSELRAFPGLIENIERAAAEYNVEIIWQPEDWHTTSASEFQSYWLPQLSQINTGTISLFTEYNYFGGNPQEYARILEMALNPANGISVPVGTTNFNTSNPTGGNPFGGSMYQYVEFLRQVQSYCSGDCLNQIPVWAGSFYADYSGGNMDAAVADFVNQFNNFRSSLESLGVNLAGKTFIIPEAGLNPGVDIQSRLNSAREFATKLEAAGIPADAITFLFMDDQTGKQYFMYKDANGNWQVAEYGDFSLIGLSGPGGLGLGDDYGKTLGEAFEISGSEGDLKETVKELMLEYFEVANIKPVGSSSDEALKKIILPEEENKTKIEKSKGFVEFYYCKKDEKEWPRKLGDEMLWFEAPAYYQQMATANYQVGDYFSLPGMNIAHPLSASAGLFQKSSFSQKEKQEGYVLLAPGNSGEFNFILDSSSSCSRSGSSVTCTVSVNGNVRNGHMWVSMNGEFLGINAVPGPGAAPNVYSHTFNCPLGENCSFNLEVVNYNYGSDDQVQYPSGHPAIGSNCTVVAGETNCSFTGAQDIPMPDPPTCEIGAYDLGGIMDKQPVSVGGALRIILDWGDWVTQLINNILKPIFESNTYVIIPIIHTPWTKSAEIIYRQPVSMPFTLPGEAHEYEAAEIEIEYSDQPGRKKGTNYGTKGEDDTYNYMFDILTPPGW